MKPRKQPRVQAQRKFAQGVHIPPQPSSSQVHSTPTPAQAQTTLPKVDTMVHMNCKEVLDLVSLKDPSVTNKRNLVVLLENIETVSLTSSKATVERNISPPSSPPLSQNRERNLLTPVKETSSRKLRSRATDSKDSEGSQGSPERSPNRRRRRRSSSVTDAEENQPLQFLSNEKQQILQSTITINVTRLEDDFGGVTRGSSIFSSCSNTSRPTPVRQRRESTSTTASSVPLAFLKAKRQGLRVSLRQMKIRNTPGHQKRTWEADQQSETKSVEGKKRKKSVSSKKGAAKNRQTSESSPLTDSIDIDNSPRKCTGKRKKKSTKSHSPKKNTGLKARSSKATNVGPKQKAINQPRPSTSTFKVPSGAAKRSAAARNRPSCQPEGEIHDFCGNCERCQIMSGVITLGENIDSPQQLTRALSDFNDSVQLEESGHDIYDFRSEDDRIMEPSPFRPRPVSVQERLSSVDSTFGSRAPDTMTVIKVIDQKIRVITEYRLSPGGLCNAGISDLVIHLLQDFKRRLLRQLNFENNEINSTSDCSTQRLPDDTTLQIAHGEMLLDAPVFRPTQEEMLDLNSYLRKIEARAARFGICKIVPPETFRPPCHMKNVSFKTNNQYISTLFNRWSPVVREMTAIKAHLATQNVTFTRPPLFEGIEVDLVKLYHLVQKYGGLIQVMRQHKWAAIAEEMKLNAERIKPDLKFDNIYIKFLLPYDTLSSAEREELQQKVDENWLRRYTRMKARAADPLLRVNRILEGAEDSDDDEESVPSMVSAFAEVEDCIVSGQKMTFERFKKIGEQVREMHFQKNVSPDPKQVEDKYWRRVENGTEHVCVYSASLDTSQDNLGFHNDRRDIYSSHPWNLKRLGEDRSNVLSYLGPTLAVTIPTLHIGMMFSTNCWHMDPHHLPWTEYLHEGPPKIWYGIAADQSDKFRAAMEKLCPTAVQNKSIWLPSDVAMVPPNLLMTLGVRLSRVLQHPAEYVIVLPKAYSCSISTGVTVSESLYFASENWLERVADIFKEMRLACEPSMFSVEQLLSGIADSRRQPLSLLKRVHSAIGPLVNFEIHLRKQLAQKDIVLASPQEYLSLYRRCTASSWQLKRDECELCRSTLFWSKIINLLGARTSVCLQHGLRLLGKRQLPEDVVALLFISNNELRELVTSLEVRIVREKRLSGYRN